jgi:hypothetical protein
MASVEKASHNPHTNVLPPTFERNDGDDLWPQSQEHPIVTHKICAPFIEYTNCTYKWAL